MTDLGDERCSRHPRLVTQACFWRSGGRGRGRGRGELGRKGELGSGLEYWRGFYQSLRPTQFGLALNIDVSARAFYVEKHFGIRNFSRALSDRDRLQKMVNGANIDYWGYVNFSRLPEDFNAVFLERLVSMCNSKGVLFNPKPLVPVISAHPNQIERVLRDIHKQSVQNLEKMGQGSKHLQLLIIILPDVSGSYGPIKRICETELGIVTQCCRPKPAQKLSGQYLENLSLKINVKVGGRNTVLNDAILIEEASYHQ